MDLQNRILLDKKLKGRKCVDGMQNAIRNMEKKKEVGGKVVKISEVIASVSKKIPWG